MQATHELTRTPVVFDGAITFPYRLDVVTAVRTPALVVCDGMLLDVGGQCSESFGVLPALVWIGIPTALILTFQFLRLVVRSRHAL